MFIANLSPQQQEILIGLAMQLIEVDGKIDDRELEMLEVLRSQCDREVKVNKFSSMDDLPSVFGDQKSRVSMLLELLAIAYADEDFDDKEKDAIETIRLKLDIPGVLFEDMESWVCRQMILSKEAQLFMEA